MHPLLVACAICFVSVAAEAAAAGKNPRSYLKSIRQPHWALPFWSWYIVGLFFYGACLVSMYMMLANDPSLPLRWRAIKFLVLIMVLNPVWNVIFFRLHSPAVSFWFFPPFAILVLLTVYTLYLVNAHAAFPFLPYLCYLPYGFAWSYSVWRLNSPFSQSR